MAIIEFGNCVSGPVSRRKSCCVRVCVRARVRERERERVSGIIESGNWVSGPVSRQKSCCMCGRARVCICSREVNACHDFRFEKLRLTLLRTDERTLKLGQRNLASSPLVFRILYIHSPCMVSTYQPHTCKLTHTHPYLPPTNIPHMCKYTRTHAHLNTPQQRNPASQSLPLETPQTS